MRDGKHLEGKGLGIGTAHSFEDEPSSMVHEQLARLKFAEDRIDLKSKRILDFGCGTGYNCYYLSEQQEPGEVVGIDILPECIEYCKRRYSSPKCGYYVQDCLVHNPELGQFDVVIGCEVIEHVSDQEKFLDVMVKYLRPQTGVALISTPNRGLFSLSKGRSFINHTHIKELFFDELVQLCRSRFQDVEVFSQIHKEEWHGAYVNYLSAYNLIDAFQKEVFERNPAGRAMAFITRKIINASLFRFSSSKYPDVRDRRFTDFEFVEGYHNRAVWFVAQCSSPVLEQSQMR